MTQPSTRHPSRPERASTLRRSLLGLLLAGCFLPVAGGAATRLDDTRARLDSLAGEQAGQRARLERLAGQERAGLARLGQLEERVESRRRLGRQLELELTLLDQAAHLQEEELRNLRRRGDSLAVRRGEVVDERTHLQSETAALARRLFPLRRLDPVSLLLKSGQPASAGRNLRRVGWLGRGLERRLARLAAMNEELTGLRQASEAASRQGAAHLAHLERDNLRTRLAREEAVREQAQLAAEGREQDRLLAGLRTDRELAAAQAERLRKAGDEVGRQLATLQRGWEEREARREQETRRQASVSGRLRQEEPVDPTRAPVPKPAPPAGRTIAPVPPADALPGGSGLAGRKGGLPRPVAGKVARPFGTRTDPELGVVLDNPGVDFSCAPGAAVRVVAGGRVEKVTWVPGFGNTLLVRHGDDGWTVYAKLDEVKVREGQAVAAGQALGTAGRMEGSSQGTLHFELWEGREARNPRDWLAP
jgi:septal ring factor EnvC (AmiA/AmiB activator)